MAQDRVGQGTVRAERPARCDRDDRRLPLLSSQHSNMGSLLPDFKQKRSLVRNLGFSILAPNFEMSIKL